MEEGFAPGSRRPLSQKEARKVRFIAMDWRQEYRIWLESPLVDAETRAELQGLTEEEAKQRFYGRLSFGTAGLRGLMGAGSARMNLYTVRHATRALAALVLEEGGAERGVAINFDGRHHSREYALAAADVLNGAGIRVLLFDDLRPTPELSYAVRRYGCMAGINVTASHNPKDYNGYKVYWEDGAQLPPARADRMAALMAEEEILAPVPGPAKADRVSLGEETDRLFLDCAKAATPYPDEIRRASGLQLLYTPFHGAGYRLVPRVLRELGFAAVETVPEQMVIDGDFPTVQSPNPEFPEGFACAYRTAEQTNPHLVIATDPDCDRISVSVLERDGSYRPLTGNQTGLLLLWYLIRWKREQGTLGARPYAVKTIVTSYLADAICKAEGIRVFNTLTGFKYMAEVMEDQGTDGFVLAYEESIGYLIGDFVRDKDGVTAAAALASMAAWYVNRDMTLSEGLEELYRTFGYAAELTENRMYGGLSAQEDMAAAMERLRQNLPVSLGGLPVVRTEDYLRNTVMEGENSRQAALPKSNVLLFLLKDGSRVVMRPSGTEPKLKIYYLAAGDSQAACDRKIKQFQQDFDRLLA